MEKPPKFAALPGQVREILFLEQPGEEGLSGILGIMVVVTVPADVGVNRIFVSAAQVPPPLATGYRQRPESMSSDWRGTGLLLLGPEWILFGACTGSNTPFGPVRKARID